MVVNFFGSPKVHMYNYKAAFVLVEIEFERLTYSFVCAYNNDTMIDSFDLIEPK